MKTLLISVIVALCVGCGAGPLAAVRPKAAEKMQCEESKLTFEQIGGGSGPGGTYYVEGCNKVGLFAAGCNVFGYCPASDGEVVSEKIRRQAAFDLSCGEKDVSVMKINADTFGATGCEKKASYLLVDCGRTNGCRVVQNTQSQ